MEKLAKLDIVVLVSVATHPVSLRSCRNSSDNSAIELALRQANSAIELVHVGTGDNGQVLKDYMGMGVASLTLLQIEEEGDPLSVLSGFLRERSPDLIITGNKGIGGEDSGLIPYFLAEDLGYNIVANVCDIEVKPDNLTLLVALPSGKRRRVSAPIHLMITVSPSVIIARQSSYARSVRGTINIIPANSEIDKVRTQWIIKPAKGRPKRIRNTAISNATVDRLAAVMGDTNDDTNHLIELPPKEAAKEILTWLKKEKIIS